jgi:ubiquinone/menaquinone biosynthesis C-methylase UbiE
MKSEETSWGGVASWYDEYLKDEDTYQAKVIWPNLKRILDIDSSSDTQTTPISLLDLACGQGYFSFLCAKEGAAVTGLDIAEPLITVANEQLKKSIQKNPSLADRLSFDVAPAHELDMIKSDTQDIVTCILALQNIRELDEAMGECARVLKQGGRFVFVINHPSFRIPQYSDWYFDMEKKIQSRLVSKYMQETSIAIDMNPGKAHGKKQITYSFHRPLQLFIKLLSKHGFVIRRLEEWCSHKKTEAGPRKEAEDKARKEIPMFMCIEAYLI